MSLWRPSSRCPKCQEPIKPWQNTPVISYIFLRGKCAKCGEKISIRYPIVELICGLLFLGAFYNFYFLQGNIYQFIVACYLSAAFLIIFMIDLDHRIIPDSISLSGIIIGFAVSFLPHTHLSWLQSLIGILVGGGVFLAVAEIGDRIFKKESMGGGDIKLAAMMGAFVGWKGILLTLALGSFFGAVIGGGALLFAKDKEAARTVPFGPFLVVGGLISYYWAEDIIRAYLNYMM
jgi:leader peptidase (prepilin peptidase)/N-methyltransferase